MQRKGSVFSRASLVGFKQFLSHGPCPALVMGMKQRQRSGRNAGQYPKGSCDVTALWSRGVADRKKRKPLSCAGSLDNKAQTMICVWSLWLLAFQILNFSFYCVKRFPKVSLELMTNYTGFCFLSFFSGKRCSKLQNMIQDVFWAYLIFSSSVCVYIYIM